MITKAAEFAAFLIAADSFIGMTIASDMQEIYTESMGSPIAELPSPNFNLIIYWKRGWDKSDV